MKFLSLINISNKDDINSDSGYIFNKILGEELFNKNHDVIYILPNELKNVEFFLGSKIYYANIGTTKYECRFSFDWVGLKKIIEYEKPDYILLNECELAVALKALLVTINQNDIKIISYCHYPALIVNNGFVNLDESLNDYNICERIVFDILQSVNISDAFFIQSDFAKRLIEKASEKYNIELKKPINVLPPPLDTYFIEYSDNFDKEPILYNHRLYENYGTEKFINITNKYKNYHFVVANPMPNRYKSRMFSGDFPEKAVEKLNNEDNVDIRNGSINRKIYKDIIKECCFALAPYRSACVWSMSVIDCISMNVPVVAPNIAFFKDFVPKELRYNNDKEFNDILLKLKSNKDYYSTVLKKERIKLNDLFPESICNDFLKILGV